MTIEPEEVLTFDRRQPDVVLALMQRLATDHDGWLVFDPGVEVEDVPIRAGLAALFSARGTEVPRCSWVPGEVRRGRAGPLSEGIQHGRGQRARPLLAASGRDVPPGWAIVGDHPKRGLVVRVPADTDHAAALTWLLDAATVLSTVAIADDWRVSVYRRG